MFAFSFRLFRPACVLHWGNAERNDALLAASRGWGWSGEGVSFTRRVCVRCDQADQRRGDARGRPSARRAGDRCRPDRRLGDSVAQPAETPANAQLFITVRRSDAIRPIRRRVLPSDGFRCRLPETFLLCVCVCVCWTALSKVRAIELNPRRARAGSDSRRVVLISFCFSSSSSSEQVYRGRNITNIVEAGRTVKIDNWCKTGHGRKCKTVQSVKPYRCLGESRRLHHLPVQGPRAALRHSGRRRCGGRPKSDNLSFSIRLRWHLEIVQPVFFFLPNFLFSSPFSYRPFPIPPRFPLFYVLVLISVTYYCVSSWL